MSCTLQGGHRRGQEAGLNSALPSCETGARGTGTIGGERLIWPTRGISRECDKK